MKQHSGKAYFPTAEPKRQSRWIRAYKNIGINIFSPIAGCSEVITSQIVYKNNLYDYVLYCENNNGKPCHKCLKCFRKNLEFKYHGLQLPDNYFYNYNESLIKKFLSTKPLYLGNIYVKIFKEMTLPNYIKDIDLSYIPELSLLKIYGESFKLFPEDIKKYIVDNLVKHYEIMSDTEKKMVECYNIIN